MTPRSAPRPSVLCRRGLLAALLVLPAGLAAQTVAVAGERTIRTGTMNVSDVQAAALSDSTAVVAWVGCRGEERVCSVWVAEATLEGERAVAVGTPREVHAAEGYVGYLKTRAFRGRVYLAWEESVRRGDVIRSRLLTGRYEPGGGPLAVLGTVPDAGFPSFVADGDSIEVLYNVDPPQDLSHYTPSPETAVRGDDGELYRSWQSLPVAAVRVQDADGTLDVFNTLGGTTCFFEAVYSDRTGARYRLGASADDETFVDGAFDNCDAMAHRVRDGYLLVWSGQPYYGGSDGVEYDSPDGDKAAVLTAVVDARFAPRGRPRILNDRTAESQYPVAVEAFGSRLLVFWRNGYSGGEYRYTRLSAETGETLGRSERVTGRLVDDGSIGLDDVHFARVGDGLVATSICEAEDLNSVTCIRVVRLSVTE